MIKKIGIGLGLLAALYAAGSLGLTFLPGPGFSERASELRRALDAGEASYEDAAQIFVDAGGPSLEQVYPFEIVSYEMSDGEVINGRSFPNGSSTTILIVHGLDGASAQFNRTAGLMRQATDANVIAIDLRGHGRSTGPRWDVAYAGQYETDVSEVISAIHAVQPGGRVILAGHSMGGGIALRFAQLASRPDVAGFLLFAPSLGLSAPTARKRPPPDADMPEDFDEPFATVRMPRIIGLSLLNAIGVHWFDHLPVVFVNLSPDPSHYTYRAILNTAPDDYIEALQSVDRPLLVIVGSDDQAFIAQEFEYVINAHSNGTTLVLEGEDHNSVHSAGEALAAITGWMAGL